MNLAIFRKAVFDQRWVLLICGLGATALPILLMHAFVSVPWEQLSGFLELPLIKTVIQVLTGADLGEVFRIDALGAFAFVHPIMLALGWACMITGATRVLAGEIDTGTADLLLALPATRISVYTSVTLSVLICGPVMAGAAWLGVWIGSRTAGLPEPIDVWLLRYVAINSAAMLLAVGGSASLISAVSSRRGKAVGVTVAILLCSFLLNWVAAFWRPAETLAFAGILRYFRPYVILRESRLQIGDVAVLLVVAAITWSLGAFLFCRRDIHTS